MRRAIVITVILGLGIVGWVILDADPDGRAELWDEVTGWFGGNDEPAPNWGDVAVKVGESQTRTGASGGVEPGRRRRGRRAALPGAAANWLARASGREPTPAAGHPRRRGAWRRY
jgi:hypothetical protein